MSLQCSYMLTAMRQLMIPIGSLYIYYSDQIEGTVWGYTHLKWPIFFPFLRNCCDLERLEKRNANFSTNLETVNRLISTDVPNDNHLLLLAPVLKSTEMHYNISVKNNFDHLHNTSR